MTYCITFLEWALFLFCQGFPTLIVDMIELQSFGVLFFKIHNITPLKARVIMNKMNSHREWLSFMWRWSNVLSAIVDTGLIV